MVDGRRPQHEVDVDRATRANSFEGSRGEDQKYGPGSGFRKVVGHGFRAPFEGA
jgi:hypothetical protein